ncbi:MAG: hypothetical protein IPG81_15390 [Sandaracinaceae bacterium]|nr:hypothetical protein [Sandaracinaceae bacterium]
MTSSRTSPVKGMSVTCSRKAEMFSVVSVRARSFTRPRALPIALNCAKRVTSIQCWRAAVVPDTRRTSAGRGSRGAVSWSKRRP